jgi:hypothetical protein
VAEELVDNYADGVIFVPLAAIRDPALVAATIARTPRRSRPAPARRRAAEAGAEPVRLVAGTD